MGNTSICQDGGQFTRNILVFPGIKDDTDRWLQLNGPVNFSYFYSKCYLKLVL